MNYNDLTEPRIGIMLHYDDSGSDQGAIDWLTKDPRCRVSYNLLVLDDGRIIEIAPDDKRAWHAGVCRSSDVRLDYKDANSAFWGIAIAARAGERATYIQKHMVSELCRSYLRRLGSLEETWRIVGHDSEAWPRGRKIDPAGPDPAKPVLSLVEVRALAGTQ